MKYGANRAPNFQNDMEYNDRLMHVYVIQVLTQVHPHESVYHETEPHHLGLPSPELLYRRFGQKPFQLQENNDWSVAVRMFHPCNVIGTSLFVINRPLCEPGCTTKGPLCKSTSTIAIHADIQSDR